MFRILVFLLSYFCAITNGSILPTLYRRVGKIVGGDAITIEEAPWIVALLSPSSDGSYTHNCGGSLISSTTVLTAAHCLKGLSPKAYKVRVGSTFKYTGGELIDSADSVFHELFSFYTFHDDIGMVFLAKPVSKDTIARPIPLPELNRIIVDGSKATAIGWGKIYENGPTSMILRSVDLPIVMLDRCRKLNQNVNNVTENMICAGYIRQGGKDACNGDSGGPLVVDDAIVGITSWGVGCARPRKPGVYTRVTSYLQWIDSHIKQSLN